MLPKPIDERLHAAKSNLSNRIRQRWHAFYDTLLLLLLRLQRPAHPSTMHCSSGDVSGGGNARQRRDGNWHTRLKEYIQKSTFKKRPQRGCHF
jgi:hypothetical protein